ncbi:MAG: hypothetical protein V5A52_02520 [Halovenus sp.]|uniref:hypothetical protein n=1 Tax=Halovenus amylolytica TaxID=2500550 RepID=UPI000FE3FA32
MSHRGGVGTKEIMETESEAAESTGEFETALQTLVLESFAGGAEVCGTWKVTSESSLVPEWQIEIERVDDGTVPGKTTFLDE